MLWQAVRTQTAKAKAVFVVGTWGFLCLLLLMTAGSKSGNAVVIRIYAAIIGFDVYLQFFQLV